MRTILISTALVLGIGCASMDDVRSDRSGGTAQRYEGPKEVVLKAAVAVLRQQGVETLEQDTEEGTVFGAIPESILGDVSSTYCGVWVDPTSDGAIDVRVVTRRRRSLSLLTGLTESTFHAELQRELARGREVDVQLTGKK